MRKAAVPSNSSEKSKALDATQTEDERFRAELKERAELKLRIEYLERGNRKLKADPQASSPKGITEDDREIFFIKASQGGLIQKWSGQLIEICRKGVKTDPLVNNLRSALRKFNEFQVLENIPTILKGAMKTYTVSYPDGLTEAEAKERLWDYRESAVLECLDNLEDERTFLREKSKTICWKLNSELVEVFGITLEKLV